MPTTNKMATDHCRDFLGEIVNLIKCAKMCAEKGAPPGELATKGHEVARVTNMDQLEIVQTILTDTPDIVCGALDEIRAIVGNASVTLKTSEDNIARGKGFDPGVEYWDCAAVDAFRHDVSVQFRIATVAMARMYMAFETYCALLVFVYHCPADACEPLLFGDTSPSDPTLSWTRASTFDAGFFQQAAARGYRTKRQDQVHEKDQQAMGQGYAPAAQETVESYQQQIAELNRKLASCEEALKAYQKDEEARATPAPKKTK